MNGRSQTSSAGLGQRSITVRRLVPTPGLTSAQIICAAKQTLGTWPVRSLSVALVDDATMAALHERYTGQLGSTDVLAFDLRDEADRDAEPRPSRAAKPSPIEGEIVVSIDTARRQAARLRVDLSTEVLRYVIHGILHLQGLDDHTRAGRARMRRAENRIIAGLAIPPASGRPARRGPCGTQRGQRRTGRRAQS